MRPRIGLVEDGADNRLLARALLDPHYEVEEFGDAETALEAWAQDPPDLLLIDIGLPGMDGVELLAALRRQPSTSAVPAIALTAYDLPGQRERFLAAGFRSHLTKPILEEALLLAAIEAGLGAAG